MVDTSLIKHSGLQITPFRSEDLSAEIVKDIVQSWLRELPIACNKKKTKCPNCVDVEGTSLCKGEINYAALLFKGYVAQLNIKNTDILDLNLIKDLVNIDLKIYRLSNDDEGEYEQDQPMGTTEEGEIIYGKQLANSVEYEDRLLNRKMKLLKQLNIKRVGANVASTNEDDYSVRSARIKSDPAMKRASKQIKAKRLGVDLEDD